MNVDLQMQGERRLPAKIEEELFRIAQEALNNIVKHAHTDRASSPSIWKMRAGMLMGIEDARGRV